MNNELYQHYLENPDDHPVLRASGMRLMPWQDGGGAIMPNRIKCNYGTWLHPVLPSDHAKREREHQERIKMREL